MSFWIVTAAMSLAIGLLLALVLMRARSAAEPAAAYDLRLYQQQLRDVDKDVARGLVHEADGERVRTEISRRILAADAAVQRHTSGNAQPRMPSFVTALAVVVFLLTGTFYLYAQLGAPGYPDLALNTRLEQARLYANTRPSQAEMEADAPKAAPPQVEQGYEALVAQLREAAAARPEDAQGQALLVRHEARLGNLKAAYQAKTRQIALLGAAATSDDYTEQAELMIIAAGGLVSPEAEIALRKALELNASQGMARYYWGLMMGQFGRPDLAFDIWRETLSVSPEDARWTIAIQAQIGDMAERAGQNYTPIAPGSALAGPSAGDIDAAAELTPQARAEMIHSMVASLSDRLASDGGTAQEWGQLIVALSVLNRVDEALTILSEARARFADSPEDRRVIDAAATQAGFAP
ncbi:c-type cytochrome biogenesis protein CcmI [Epibacterium ulvae]|uniref:c-type cytochrome biogenesis protein CcmI n=1 Tax=Epibacterium ulvae TaxID=1156985 RepID=UPI00249051D2|nr:c-type cytochrome biogenesis protein CcmI [Epibacterium ulvae]